MYKKLLGAYKDNGKAIYRLHPCVKFLLSLIFVITAGLTGSVTVIAALVTVLFLAGYAAGITPFYFLTVLRPFRFLLLFTFVIQLFLTATGHWVMPDFATLGNAVFFTLKIAVMIGFSSLFTVITPPVDIVRIFYILFQPLLLLRISPADAALSMLIALRFIPLLFTEGEKIMDSLRLRGILPEKGDRKGRLKIALRSASLVVPLFVRTFHYAAQIGVTLNYRRRDAEFLRLPRPTVVDFACGTLFMVTGVILIMVGNVL